MIVATITKLEIIGRQDISLLSDICEAASLYLDSTKKDTYAICGLDKRRRYKMIELVGSIQNCIPDNIADDD